MDRYKAVFFVVWPPSIRRNNRVKPEFLKSSRNYKRNFWYWSAEFKYWDADRVGGTAYWSREEAESAAVVAAALSPDGLGDIRTSRQLVPLTMIEMSER